jgi:hypothetical protein
MLNILNTALVSDFNKIKSLGRLWFLMEQAQLISLGQWHSIYHLYGNRT